jgi:hypothetical protein
MNDSSPSRRRPPNSEVKRVVEASGRTQKEVADYLSRRLGRSFEHYHVSRMISGARPVQSDEMDALRELAAAPTTEAPAAPQLVDTGDAVPLFGYANAAGATLRISDGAPAGVVPVHPAQRGHPGAFAFIVFGDSISPRLEHGDVAYAIRGLPPLRDKPVLIELKDGDAQVKIFARMDANTVFVRELQPKARDLQFPLRDIRALHRVVGSTF